MSTRVQWRKSSYSDSRGNVCVELGRLSATEIGIRDSKFPEKGHLTVSRQALAGLVGEIKSGALTA